MLNLTVNSFYWRTAHEKQERCEKMAAIINAMTPEQKEAVEFYADSECNELAEEMGGLDD